MPLAATQLRCSVRITLCSVRLLRQTSIFTCFREGFSRYRTSISRYSVPLAALKAARTLEVAVPAALGRVCVLRIAAQYVYTQARTNIYIYIYITQSQYVHFFPRSKTIHRLQYPNAVSALIINTSRHGGGSALCAHRYDPSLL